ncbi:3-mercaptopyruvate sulfurtransferase [Yersinia pestis]|uniref:Sulfurtransferase n=16 Tax=Yersinia pseudotuberculosis complex TaxID=1649845 RepID=A0AAX2HZT1_YERPE|nr:MULTISPECIES: 3-mercaptopyruvate sulfurtransferase [Yersinia pseudotuberculosis complex]EDR32355.1 3-mercaptopyruvate sulfurtransferase [Yersinia pestis biovar Orientalis str. IP275]EFA46464.1 3-mercaptopyruvate sulfurtransferase [Yersinia pestis KIM D27]ERP75809.1 3-mercaptopyruvate sulfurtransferase [Yersinia pestis S3]ERP76465.1 3-mercaptopyruvate sulfurtransferase [Yersinia pestis 24H]ERP83587.1 3-mercaptopyruvate sulfurtransferase [Yersinia pestis 9]
MNSDFLVTPQWLAAHANDANIVILDARMSPPGVVPKRNIQAEFEQGHIPGAVYFDIDAIADHSTGLPHMLPSPQLFSEMAGQLGITEQHTVVIYDEGNLFSAPRVWWTFRTFGAKNVRILASGLSGWQQAGYKLESGPAHPTPQTFNVTFNAAAVSSVDEVLAVLGNNEVQILDARPSARYRAQEPEPRPGLRLGRIPGSINIPWGTMVENGHLKSPQALAEIFAAQGVDLTKPIITSCGSGVTAAVVVLGLAAVNARSVSLYDGSWAEWGASNSLPIDATPLA